MSYTKRAQANSVESEQKEDWDKDVSRKLSSTTVGSKGEMAASPLVGPERKKSTTVPSVSVCAFGLLNLFFSKHYHRMIAKQATDPFSATFFWQTEIDYNECLLK